MPERASEFDWILQSPEQRFIPSKLDGTATLLRRHMRHRNERPPVIPVLRNPAVPVLRSKQHGWKRPSAVELLPQRVLTGCQRVTPLKAADFNDLGDRSGALGVARVRSSWATRRKNFSSSS